MLQEVFNRVKACWPRRSSPKSSRPTLYGRSPWRSKVASSFRCLTGSSGTTMLLQPKNLSISRMTWLRFICWASAASGLIPGTSRYSEGLIPTNLSQSSRLSPLETYEIYGWRPRSASYFARPVKLRSKPIIVSEKELYRSVPGSFYRVRLKRTLGVGMHNFIENGSMVSGTGVRFH